MGLEDFFKKTFGKQVCAFCGKGVGMMRRDKIKNDEFVCSNCHGKKSSGWQLAAA